MVYQDTYIYQQHQSNVCKQTKIYMDGMGLFGVNLHHLEVQMLISSPFFERNPPKKSKRRNICSTGNPWHLIDYSFFHFFHVALPGKCKCWPLLFFSGWGWRVKQSRPIYLPKLLALTLWFLMEKKGCLPLASPWRLERNMFHFMVIWWWLNSDENRGRK